MYNLQSKTFTVTQINQYIKFLFEKDYALSSISVKGEISNFKHHSSGHMYFTVKDENSSLNCVMFKMMAECLKFKPENGMSVVVEGRISVYERTGQYQLYADNIQISGKGDLHVAFELLKQRLFDEGLFDESHKNTIPQYPNTVGVITSPTGAAVRDIIQIGRRRNPTVKLVVMPIQVQGENSADDIVKAIRYMNQWGKADILIVGRGGGSIEDLWSFNEEVVARAIYNSKIPIISAVGHEIDYTISDFVADLRAPTPSAAAEMAIPNLDDLKNILYVDRQCIENSIVSKLKNSKSEIDDFRTRILSKNPIKYIENSKQHLLEIKRYMDKNIKSVLYKSRQQLIYNSEKLEAVSPLSILKRGYSIVYSQDRTVTSVENVKEDDILKIQMNDGYLNVKVKSKEK